MLLWIGAQLCHNNDMPPAPASSVAPLSAGTLNLQQTTENNPKIQLPPGGGFGAIASPASTPQQGITLRQAILQAKANPTSEFAGTLGKFLVNGDADMQAMKEGIDLSFAGRPSLQQMYSDHLTKNNVQMPGDSPLETLRNGFMDLINKAGDDTVEQQKEGTQKIESSIEEGAQKESDNATRAFVSPGSPESRAPVNPEDEKSLAGAAEAGLGTASGAVQGIFAPITGIIQAISDKAADTDAVQEFAEHGTGPLLDLYDQLDSKIKEISTAHPEAARNTGDAANVLLSMLGGESGAGEADVGAAGAKTAQTVSEAAQGAKETVQAAAESAGKASTQVGKTITDTASAAGNKLEGAKTAIGGQVPLTAKGIFSKIYRLPPEDIDFLTSHPEYANHEALSAASIHNLGREVEGEIAKAKSVIPNPSDLAEEVRSAALEKSGKIMSDTPKPEDLTEEVRQGLQKKIQALNEHAKLYNTFGNDALPGVARKGVNIDPNWLADTLQKEVGVKVHEGANNPKSGQIEATGESKVNDSSSPGGLQRLQNLFREWQPIFSKGKISRATFLKFRQDLAAMADYQGGLDTNMKQAAHRIRDNFNTTYRKQIPGLDKIDAEHTRMERDLEDSVTGVATVDKSSGSPKIKMNEGAASNILNGTKDTKTEFAKRLESIVPGITSKIKKIEDANAQVSRLTQGLIDEKGNLTDTATGKIAGAKGAGKDVLAKRLESLVPGIGEKISKMNDFKDAWKSLVDEGGNLRENALHNIKNSLNSGKDIRLEKLETLMPGITKRLQHVRAAENFNAAMKGVPGSYVGAGAISQIFTGNPLLGLSYAVATQPNVGLKILQAIGKAKQ